MTDLDVLPDPKANDIQSLVERFATARWIERAIVTQDPFSILWSQKGRLRMARLHNELAKLRRRRKHGFFGRSFATLLFVCRLIPLTLELRSPQFSKREESALMAIVATLEIGPDGMPTPVYSIKNG